MSYILDALRKAEAERARGAVPGVHAQQGPDDAPRGAGRQAVKLLTAAVVVLLVALAGVIGWQWMDRRPEMASAPTRDETIAQAPAAPITDTAPPRGEAPGRATGSPPPATTAPAAQPAPQESTIPPSLPAQALEQPRALPVRPVPEAAPAATTTTRTSTQGTPSGASHPATSPSANPTTVANAQRSREPVGSPPAQPAPRQAPEQIPQQQQQQQQRTYALNELPDTVRSSLPNYSINGASYSENPAARLLIVNGQIAHEGDMLPGGAVLEQIKLKSAVLRWKGYHVEMTY